MRTLLRLLAIGLAIYGFRRLASRASTGRTLVPDASKKIHNPMFYREGEELVPRRT